MDLESLKTSLPQFVPFVSTLGIVYEHIDPTSARLRLPDARSLHNHVGGLHAGALFTLGESASGAVVIAAFGDRLGELTPLVAKASIDYRRFAKGDIVAVATVDQEVAETANRPHRDDATRFPVSVELTRDEGEVTCTMTVEWVLKRSSPSGSRATSAAA